jgi:hypothetical protein
LIEKEKPKEVNLRKSGQGVRESKRRKLILNTWPQQWKNEKKRCS